MKTSVCFLGAGFINGKHARVLRRLFPKMRLGIASRDLRRAEDFQKRFGLETSFPDYKSAVASDFSVIVIGLPPKFHFDWVREGLDAGKHLVVEKPIFNSLDEFRKLLPTLEKSRTLVMVAENQWFDPFHRKIKKCLQENDFGRPLFFDLIRLGKPKPKDWFADPAQMPLGALHEGGVHWIRRLLDLANVYETDPYQSVLGVKAYQPPFFLSDLPEDTMMVMTRHRSGLVSRLYHSWGIPKRAGGFFDFSKLHLEKGTICFDGRGAIGFVFGKRKKILWPSLNDLGGFKTMWRHYIACAENGKKPDLSLNDIYLDFAYMDAAYRSIRSGKEETLQQ